jgi:hypothetical protein
MTELPVSACAPVGTHLTSAHLKQFLADFNRCPLQKLTHWKYSFEIHPTVKFLLISLEHLNGIYLPLVEIYFPPLKNRTYLHL